MEKHKKLLLSNKAWAQSVKRVDPLFFERLSIQQNPGYLWIGCSDSRVPADKVTGSDAGEMFVHRNIANLVVENDLNLLSVLQYAVQVLKVEHVIICGHYGCGGINAAMTTYDLGMINNWLKNIKDVYAMHKAELDAIENVELRSNRLVELNVQEQVANISRTAVMKEAWSSGNYPYVHGWVYGLSNGIIQSVCEISDGKSLKVNPLGSRSEQY